MHSIYTYIYIYISATALLAVRRASSYSVLFLSCYTSMKLLSIGPWGPWVLDGLGDLFWVGPCPEAGH